MSVGSDVGPAFSSSHASSAPKLPHRDDVQGLRAVAVLLVVLTHAGTTGISGGFVGVDVFFVVSGFLITGLLLAEARAHGTVSLSAFYLRRARRILPAAALTLLATDIAAYFVLNFVRAQGAVTDSVHAAAFAANLQFASQGMDYFARDQPLSPVLHYWSLSVEEQFYFVWPLLLTLALFGFAFRRHHSERHERRLLGVVVVLSLASLAWSMHRTSTLPTDAYFSPFTRAWELGLGATIAVSAASLERLPGSVKTLLGWIGLGAIALAAVALSDSTPFPGTAALLPTAGTGLAIVAGMGTSSSRFAVGRLLSLRPMCFVGDRSYALYLWHWPALILGVAYVGHDIGVLPKLGLLAAAFALSCVSYAYFENPIRHRVRSRPATITVAVVCTGAVLATSALALGAIDRREHAYATRSDSAAMRPKEATGESLSAQGALPAVIAAVRAANRGAPIPTGLRPPMGQLRNFPEPYALPEGCISDAHTSPPGKICRVGRPSSRVVVVLIGDSHAMMWLPALLETAWREDWAVIPLLRLGCTPGEWTAGTRSSCRAWYQWALDEVHRLHPHLTLLGGSVPERETPERRAATAGVIATATTLSQNGRVIVIGDPEGLSRDPVDCLLAPHASMSDCTTTWSAETLVAYNTVRREVRRLDIPFLPTRGFVCYRDECPAVVGRTVVWMDTNHLTVAYSAELARAFRTELLRALAKTL